ncbi:RNA polymerase ECF family sigma subunit [Motilibacter rhizosphaerae]|uniref:RNA polymerase ECF family sigma subunit n=1 Tax=Motilibacter rhizosphaerae TaxID=598652 RepID=A0A4Q7NVD3_9ACTN|nr:RNA polymerase sigma factor SigM [Motilibacter rhizosphaerae]RZS91216.1 RNA polymerase ECF family sigma subunit [Motilibacter rhizosphaerae]
MSVALGDLLDSELAARAAEGDREAFGELVRRHRDRLWAVALRTLGDREEAADAVQDGLVNAYRAVLAGGYRGDAAVTTWLHRIVVNACLDRVRRRQSRPVVPLVRADGSEHDVPTSRDAVGQHEDRLDLARALATLPEEQRAALVLVDVQGMSVREAAAVLEVAEGTVKSRCARGRARLLPLLAPGRRAEGTAP